MTPHHGIRRYVLVPQTEAAAPGDPAVRRYRLARFGAAPRGALGDDRHERLERAAGMRESRPVPERGDEAAASRPPDGTRPGRHHGPEPGELVSGALRPDRIRADPLDERGPAHGERLDPGAHETGRPHRERLDPGAPETGRPQRERLDSEVLERERPTGDEPWSEDGAGPTSRSSAGNGAAPDAAARHRGLDGVASRQASDGAPTPGGRLGRLLQ
jgi:hypothetical protein